MGAAPKTKVSRHRRGNRRRHQRLSAPHLITCKSCGELMKSHYVCRSCGQYNRRQVITIAAPTAE